MSSVFSADPPIFVRPPAQQATRPVNSHKPFDSSFTSTASASSSSTLLWDNDDCYPQIMQQGQGLQEQRAQERNAQKEWEERRTQQVRQDVAKKVTAYIKDLSQQCQHGLQNDWKDEHSLAFSAKQEIDAKIELYKTYILDTEKKVEDVDRSIRKIQVWLEQAEENKVDEANIGIDDLVQPAHRHHEQMLNLSAENAAITDALYFLDRALHQGHLDLDTHLRQVRSMSKRQFLVRAHLLKISQIIMVHGRSPDDR